MKELTKATILSPLLSDIEFGYVEGLALINWPSQSRGYTWNEGRGGNLNCPRRFVVEKIAKPFRGASL